MNTPTLVRQKAAHEKICEFKTSGNLYFPREDPNGTTYVISSTGELFQFNESTSQQVLSLSGQPNGLCFDNNGYVYVTDLGSNCIFFKQLSSIEQNPVIEQVIAKEYDGNNFKGPTALTYNKEDNLIYFSDSGLFENASLSPFDCKIYSIDLETRVLRLILNNLSFVSDICYDSNFQCLYVAETFMNRVIRLKQNDNGIFISSVFYQFSGRVGPSALTIEENGNLFVARYEYSTANLDMDNEADGIISVINKDGILIGELNLPKLPEITGLYIPPKKRENLYVTVMNSTAVFKIKISSFSTDMDKYEEALNTIDK